MEAWDCPVRAVPGFGPKRSKMLEKLNIRTLSDALRCYPRGYEDRTNVLPIARLQAGEKAAVRAVVGVEPSVHRVRKGLELTKLRIFDESGVLELVYFNNRYGAAQLRQGHEYIFYGRVEHSGRVKTMYAPSHEPVQPGQTGGRIVPVYPLTAGLRQSDLLRLTDAALSRSSGQIEDPLPTALRDKYGLPDLDSTLRQIHRPVSLAQTGLARRRLMFEELLLFSCGVQRLRQARTQEKGLTFPETGLDGFWQAIGFLPTQAQRRAVADVAQDVAAGKPMNRLVQGDVGSGKTVVAAALCMLAVQNGWQAAVMAPTEILAAQHTVWLQKVFAPLGVSVVQMTGSMTPRAHNAVQQAILDRTAQIVVGTHALIQEKVQFANLGAIVVDEQHRFGVAQRTALRHKGQTPHTLVMSATPIPRTLALLLYGDLDVSIIDELPPGRTPVKTYAVGEAMRPRIQAFMEKQIAAGGQVYVVCPLVEEGESGLKSAEAYAHTLQSALPGRRIGVLHGRMRPDAKRQMMAQFSGGNLDVLVATTVIEVGVNVPNANLMVVEDADRFGLSQLHQLRGRVGRGRRESYCILFGADKGQAAQDRLRVLTRTNDGFEIARADLAQRGPGEFFGKRQHGLPAFQTVDPTAELALVQCAQKEAEQLYAQDPTLAAYPALAARVEGLFRDDSVLN